MDVLFSRLQETVRTAMDRSSFYRDLYSGTAVANIDDFKNLPCVTPDRMATADGATEFTSIDDGQLVMELSGMFEESNVFPFTSIENEHDMERRYHRTIKMLAKAKADWRDTVILTDSSNIYFAAQIERILPWPLAVALAEPNRTDELRDILTRIGAKTVIAATRERMEFTLPDCGTFMTFNQPWRSTPQRVLNVRTLDVLTTNLIPWLAVSCGDGIYDTLDADELTGDDSCRRQFFLERGGSGTLVVTILNELEKPGAIPVVRYDIGLPVTGLTSHTFTVAQDRRL